MQGIKRKVVYVVAYEVIAVAVCSGGFVAFSDTSLQMAGALSLATSVIAALWNFIFNMLFEAWESRQARRGRSLLRRIGHALSFEVVLFAMFVPLISWWLNVSLAHAFAMNLGLAAFFIVYTFVFAWAFDRLFGLPTSAQSLSPATIASHRSKGATAKAGASGD